MQQSQEQKEVDDGFQSVVGDEQEIDLMDQFNGANQKQDQQQSIPSGRSITNKNYSLYPDMVNGWLGPAKISHPIPITTNSPHFDRLVSYIMQQKIHEMRVCYLGPRYDNSFFAWSQMPFQFPYSHLQPPNNMKFTNRAFIGQHSDTKSEISFDSFFQSSNLDCAINVGENQYDLYLRVDSNTRGHFQWFNFTVQNLKPRTTYKLNICNLQKDQSLYTRGMKPYIYSKVGREKIGRSWSQQGDNIRYEKKASKSLAYFDPKIKNFYQLSFEISTKYEDDILQIAYCIPYTYSELTKFLKILKSKAGQRKFYSESRLCKSLGGLPVPLITITEQLNEDSNFKIKKLRKKCIVLAARVHPGESNSSFVLEGFLEFLCSNNKYARHIRSHIVFKIIPMLNPDGVVMGNYRTGLSGKDFNREYLKPDSQIFPQISNLKKLIFDYKRKFGQNFLMFIDFHGHSAKKNIFMYGPEYSLADRLYYQSRMLPKILSKQTMMFRYYSCIFRIQSDKKTTARAVFMQNGIGLSYSLETSNFGYYDTQQLKNIVFTEKNWIQMGKQLVIGISEYLSHFHRVELLRLEKIQKRQLQKLNTVQKNTKGNRLVDRKKDKRQSKPNEMKLNYGRIKGQDINEDEEDFTRYIYREIQQAEQQRKNYLQKLQNQKQNNSNLAEQDSDCESIGNDLSQKQINSLYQRIKKKSDFQTQQIHSPNQEVRTSAIEFKVTEKQSIVPERYVHRRSKSVRNHRPSERQKYLSLKEPTKILIGVEMRDQQPKVFSNQNVSDKSTLLSKEPRDKRKTFQQFIQQKNIFEKQVKKSLSNKRIHNRILDHKLIDIQSSQFEKYESPSPIKNQSSFDNYKNVMVPQNHTRKPKNIEQKKIEIYKQIHSKHQQKSKYEEKSRNYLKLWSPTKLKTLIPK